MSEFKTVKVFEPYYKETPREVSQEIEQMWADYELGNNHCYKPWNKEMEDIYPALAKYLKEKGIQDSDEVLIHYWW